MKYDGVRIKVNLVQSMEYVDGRRSMDVNMNIFRTLYISCADVLSHSTVTSRAVKSRLLRTCQQLEVGEPCKCRCLYFSTPVFQVCIWPCKSMTLPTPNDTLSMLAEESFAPIERQQIDLSLATLCLYSQPSIMS